MVREQTPTECEIAVEIEDRRHSDGRATLVLRGQPSAAFLQELEALNARLRIVEPSQAACDSWRQGPHTPSLDTTLPRVLLVEMGIVTGYSNERLAHLLGVSRRSFTNWFNGGRLQEAKAEKIRNLTRLIRYVDRGTAERNQAALLASTREGRTAYAAVADGQLDEAAEAVGPGTGCARRMRQTAAQTHSTPELPRPSEEK